MVGCVDVPGLNQIATTERLWPSQVGCCGGPPHSYVRMPYGLPSMAAAYQRLMRGILEAQEDRRSAALAEMEAAREEPSVPPEPPEAPGPGGSRASPRAEPRYEGRLSVKGDP